MGNNWNERYAQTPNRPSVSEGSYETQNDWCETHDLDDCSSCSPVFIKVMLLNRAFIINVLSRSHIYNCRARGVFAPLSQGYGPSAITRQ